MTAAMGQARHQSGRRGVNWLQRHIRPEQVRELSLLLLIIVAVLIFGSLIDGYYTARTFNRIASSVAIITVVAVGQTLVVLTRNIDLSVGSIVGCTAYLRRHADRRPPRHVARSLAVRDRGRARRRHGRGQRRAGRLGPGAVDHRDARHAGDLSRHPGRTVRREDGVTTDKLPSWLVDLPTLDAVQHRRHRHPRDGRAGARRRGRLPVAH